MRHALCVYPETAEALAGAPQEFDLELQSFGLRGVRSPRSGGGGPPSTPRWPAGIRTAAGTCTVRSWT